MHARTNIEVEGVERVRSKFGKTNAPVLIMPEVDSNFV